MTEPLDLAQAGMATALSNEDPGWTATFNQMARAYFRDMARGSVFTAEDMRRALTERGLPQPHHQNVWGGVFNSLRREWQAQGFISFHGYGRGRTASSHGRLVRVYRKESA